MTFYTETRESGEKDRAIKAERDREGVRGREGYRLREMTL